MSSVLESESVSSDCESEYNNGAPSIPVSEYCTHGLLQNQLEEYNQLLSKIGLSSTDEEDHIITSELSYIDDNESLELHQKAPLTTSKSSTFTTLVNTQKTSCYPEKISIRFRPIGSIAQVDPKVCKIGSSQEFSIVLMFLKKKLLLNEVHCYISNSFAPTPQQIVGQLWNQFKIKDELLISYCATVAFG